MPITRKSITTFRKRVRRNFSKPRVALPVKRYIKKTIDRKTELKEHVQQGDSTDMSTVAVGTWVSDPLAEIAQGTTDAERVGDKIKLSRIYTAGTMRFTSYSIATNLQPGMSVLQLRILLVQLKRGFDITDFLAQLPTTSVTAPLNKFDIQRRGYILGDLIYTERPDKYYTVSQSTVPTSLVYAVSDRHTYKFSVKPKIHTIEWDSDTTAASSPDIQGSIHLCYLSLVTGSGTPQNTVEVQTDPDFRLTFRDM